MVSIKDSFSVLTQTWVQVLALPVAGVLDKLLNHWSLSFSICKMRKYQKSPVCYCKVNHVACKTVSWDRHEGLMRE